MAMKRDLEMYDDASTDLMMGEGEPVQYVNMEKRKEREYCIYPV